MTSDSDSTGGDPIYTPSNTGTESPSQTLRPAQSSSRQPSPTPLRISSLPSDIKQELHPDHQHPDTAIDDAFLSDDDDPAMSGRPPYRRPSGGLSNTPLLSDKPPNHSPSHQRRDSSSHDPMTSSFHSRHTLATKSPVYTEPPNLTRRKYIYASFFLLVSLVSFVVQTETAVYIQHELHWDKAYCMLWLTHGSWSLLYPIQLIILRVQKRKLTWSAFWRRHKSLVTSTASMVRYQDLYLNANTTATSPWPYMIKTTSFITTFLTFAGGSWYVAVNLTSPSDLTAIYNCSAFFAYVFSILLLHDKLRLDKMVSVFLAILGVLVVAYGDTEEPKHGSHSGGSTNPDAEVPDNKLVGNLIIGVGSVMYGFYEVLYKKYACPPEGASPGRSIIFANSFAGMIGTFTLCVLWIPLPILHFTGVEPFELPTGKTAALLAISTLSNAVFSGSFLVLMSLTSPVLSSVAALLTIFLVAITDWLITGKPLSLAAITGGSLIIVAFVMLSWATYREMSEEQKKRDEDDVKVDDDEVGLMDEDSEDELGRDGVGREREMRSFGAGRRVS
jgi:drug/metabolite transporter (DMT)-like permease